MTPLQQIPAKVRLWLYWTGYLVGVSGQGTTIVWGAIAAASPEVSMPLQLVIASAVLGLLQTQLNLLSGSNTYEEGVVPAAEVVVQDTGDGPVAGPASIEDNGTPMNVAPKLLR